MRKLLYRTATGLAAVTVAVLSFAVPAHAASIVRYAIDDGSQSKCLQAVNQSDARASLGDCRTMRANEWKVEDKTNPAISPNTMVKLVNQGNNRCLDSYTNSTSTVVYAIGCNTGNNQLWEVFFNSDGSRTFKSWGSWKSKGTHLCLYWDVNIATLATCNANAAHQQWIRQA